MATFLSSIIPTSIPTLYPSQLVQLGVGPSPTSPLYATTLTSTGAASFASMTSASVSISGGTLNGVTIGATVASSAKFTTLAGSGAASFGSTLSVSGTATFNGTVTFNASVAHGSNAVSGSNFTITGGALSGVSVAATSLSASAATTLSGSLAVGGASTFSGSANFVQSPTVPTPAVTDSSYAVANTSWVTTALSNAINGLQIKATATVATAALLPAYTVSGSTLTASTNGALIVDGYTVQVGDLVLVKNETSQANNGLYVVAATGGSSSLYSLTRHPDMNDPSEFSGAFIPVGPAGTLGANSLWLCNPVGPVTVGTTLIPFTQLNGATSILAGPGVQISGNTISAAIAAISGGTVDGATIGATSPSSGVFTSLSATTTTLSGTLTAGAGGSSVAAPALVLPSTNASYSGSVLKFYNDGNAHIETNYTFQINQRSATPTTVNLGGGALTVGGATTLQSALTVSGATTLNGSLAAGAASFSTITMGSTVGSAGAASKIALYGTSYGFGVSAGSLDYVSSFNHTLYVGSSVVATVSSSGTSLTGTLGVSGATSLASTLGVTGAISGGGGLILNGSYPSVVFYTASNSSGKRYQKWVYDTSGTVQFQTLDDDGSTALSVPLAVGPTGTSINTLTVSQSATVGGNISVTGNTSLGGLLSVAGTAAVTGAATLGSLTVTGTTVLSTTNVSGVLTASANGASINLNNVSAGQQTAIGFLDAGTGKWQMGKQTDNSFFLYDVVANKSILIASGGTISFPFATSVGGTLNVSGATTAGAITSSGTVQAAQISSTGALLIAGTAGISGATTLSSTLAVAGATTLSALTVSGTTTFNGIPTIATTGNAVAILRFNAAGGAANQTYWDFYANPTSGNLSFRVLSDDLATSANAIVISRSGATVGTVAISGSALTVAGAATFGSALAVTGAATFSSGVTVSGSNLNTANIVVNNQIYSASGVFYLQFSNTTGGVSICGQGGATTIGGTLAVSGATTLNSTVAATGAISSSTGIEATGLLPNSGQGTSNGVHLSFDPSTNTGYLISVLAGTAFRTLNVTAGVINLNATGNPVNVNGGPFTVSGATTLSSTLSVTGASTFAGITSSGIISAPSHYATGSGGQFAAYDRNGDGSFSVFYRAGGFGRLWGSSASKDHITFASGQVNLLENTIVSGNLNISGNATATAFFATVESHFSNGTYSDPANGVNLAVKISGGLAVSGTTIFTSDPQVNGGSISPQMKALLTTTGGGSIIFDTAANFSWSARFICMNAGNSSLFSTNGYFDITMPASGSVVTGYNGAPSYTMTSSATIPIGNWQTLYYILPIGAGNPSLSANFALVAYGSGSFVVPAHWLPLATRNNDSNRLYVMGGRYILAPGDGLDTTTYRTGIYTAGSYAVGGSLTVSNSNRLYLRGSSSGVFQIFDDTNAHLESDTLLWINQLTANPVTICSGGGLTTVGAGLNVGGNISATATTGHTLGGLTIATSGSLTLPTGGGLCQFLPGNGDGGSLSTYGTVQKIWNGLALSTYDGSISAVFDSRGRQWDTVGGYRINGTTIVDASRNMYNMGIGTFGGTVTAPTFSATSSNSVALYMSTNSAFRDTTNGASTMYFDVSSGGTGQGQWMWRSTNGYTQRMLLDTGANLYVAGNVNTPAALVVAGNTVVNGNQVYVNSGPLYLGNAGTGNVSISNSGGTTTVLNNLTINGPQIYQSAQSPRNFYIHAGDGGVRAFMGTTYQAMWFGFDNPTGTNQAGVNSGACNNYFAITQSGVVGSVTNTGFANGFPTFRNTLDNGGGSATIAANLTVSGGNISVQGNVNINSNQVWTNGGALYLQYNNGSGGVNICAQGGTTSVGGLLSANGGINVGTLNAGRTDFAGLVTFYDAGGRNYWAGIVTEAQAQLIDIGINTDQTSAPNGNAQGGLFRVDTRSGAPLFQWLANFGRSTVASMDSGGSLNLNGYVSTTKGGAQFLAPGYMHYSDGASFYILLTGSGSPTPNFNGLRPFNINLSNGRVGMQNGCDLTGGFNVDTVTASNQFVGPNSPKAWVIFNQGGGLIAAHNISSVSASGNNTFTINFPDGTFPDANYAYATGTQTDNNAALEGLVRVAGGTKTATAIQFYHLYSGGATGGNKEMSIVFYHR